MTNEIEGLRALTKLHPTIKENLQRIHREARERAKNGYCYLGVELKNDDVTPDEAITIRQALQLDGFHIKQVSRDENQVEFIISWM